MEAPKTYPITLPAMAVPAVRKGVSSNIPAAVFTTIITTTTITPEGV